MAYVHHIVQTTTIYHTYSPLVPEFRSAVSRTATSGPAKFPLVRDLFSIIALLRPWGALFLALVSIAESFVVSQSGLVSGQFYRVIVDHRPDLFPALMLRAVLYWSLAALLAATSTFLANALALLWRAQLVRRAHAIAAPPGALRRLASALSTIDQRVTTDTLQLAEAMSNAAKSLVAAPFRVIWVRSASLIEQANTPKNTQQQQRSSPASPPSPPSPPSPASPSSLVLQYSYLTWSLVGSTGVLACYVFFAIGAVLQSFLVRPIATLVRRQENVEGRLRAAHVRRLEMRAEIDLMGGGETEREALEGMFDRAILNAWKLTVTNPAQPNPTQPDPLQSNPAQFNRIQPKTKYMGHSIACSCIGGPSPRSLR